jgi:hypothetical protein
MARDAETVTTDVTTDVSTEVTVDGTTEVTHRIEVAAPATAVYRIVAEVGLWPLYFPPTVRAERTGGDETDERIRIWALANGELRTWESRRRLDPAGLRIEFAQIEPREPVAAMGGTWRITERPDAAARWSSTTSTGPSTATRWPTSASPAPSTPTAARSWSTCGGRPNAGTPSGSCCSTSPTPRP